MIQQFLFWLSKRIKIRILKGYLPSSVQYSQEEKHELTMNVHQQMNVYTHNRTLFIHKKEKISYALTWVNFGDIMLSEIRTQKNKYCMTLSKVFKVAELIETGSNTMVAMCWGRNTELVFNGSFSHSRWKSSRVLTCSYQYCAVHLKTVKRVDLVFHAFYHSKNKQKTNLKWRFQKDTFLDL